MIIAGIGEQLAPNVSGYCSAADLPVRGVARQWKYRGVRRSIMWRGGGVVKIADAFEDHRAPDDFAALLAEAERRGVNMPSSYADLFHRKWHAPPIRRAHAKAFQGEVKGGWIRVMTPNARVNDPFWHYDIRSAYLAATAQGLPDPRTFRLVTRWAGPGVYWVDSPELPHYPYPWYRAGVFPASWEEIEFLCLRSRIVGKGVAFDVDTFDAAGVVRDIRAWSCYKAIGRAFWGRWAASRGPTMETLDLQGKVRTARDLPPLWACPTWAVIITSRVRLRLSEVYDKGGVLMVLTDAVVTTRPLATGPNIGDWREVAHFPQGGSISLAGISGNAA